MIYDLGNAKTLCQHHRSANEQIAHNKQKLPTSKINKQRAKRLTGVSDRLTGVLAKSDSKEHQRLTSKKERHRATKSAKNSQRAKRATPTAKIMAQMRIVTKQHKI